PASPPLRFSSRVASTATSTLSLHDALPICQQYRGGSHGGVQHGSGRLSFGGVLVLGFRLGNVGFADPAGLDAGLHDHGFGIVARNLEAVENAGVLGLLAAILALGPADQIVGGAAEIGRASCRERV